MVGGVSAAKIINLRILYGFCRGQLQTLGGIKNLLFSLQAFPFAIIKNGKINFIGLEIEMPHNLSDTVNVLQDI
jgi:hypothetical protein